MSSIAVDLSRLPECVNPAFYPLIHNRTRWEILMGGGGSGKSVFEAQKHLVRAITEPGHRILALRKVAATIKASVWQLLNDIIDAWEWDGLIAKRYKQEYRLQFKNGSEIFCKGLDDKEKVKSIAGVTSMWVEEATEFTEEEIDQLNIRLRGMTKYAMQIALTFNPISVMHWLKRRFFDSPVKNCRVHVSTYRDNRWCGKEYVEIMEELKRTNPAMYKVYGEGKWGLLEGLIYDPPPVIAAADWPGIEWFDEVIYGLDFGFKNPTALAQIGIKDGNCWVNEKLYQTGITTGQLVEMLPDLVHSRTAPIYADAAEPDRIAEIEDAGWNVIPAHKGQGSVIAGIDTCKAVLYRLCSSAVNIIKEFHAYSWKEDRHGNPLDEPAKFYDHAMDAIRYAIHTHIAKNPAVSFEGGALAGVGVWRG